MLKDYESEVLRKLRDNEIIGYKYSPLEMVARKIKWDEIAAEYGVRKSFKKVIRKLVSKGLVDDHGKSLQVASLSRSGRNYLLALETDDE